MLPASFGPTAWSAAMATPREARAPQHLQEYAMIIVMRHDASAKQIAGVVAHVETHGLRVNIVRGEERTIIGVIGDDRPIDGSLVEQLDGVEKTVPILKPFKLASREMHPPDTLGPLGGMKVGGNKTAIMASPDA